MVYRDMAWCKYYLGKVDYSEKLAIKYLLWNGEDLPTRLLLCKFQKIKVDRRIFLEQILKINPEYYRCYIELTKTSSNLD